MHIWYSDITMHTVYANMPLLAFSALLVSLMWVGCCFGAWVCVKCAYCGSAHRWVQAPSSNTQICSTIVALSIPYPTPTHIMHRQNYCVCSNETLQLQYMHNYVHLATISVFIVASITSFSQNPVECLKSKILADFKIIWASPLVTQWLKWCI